MWKNQQVRRQLKLATKLSPSAIILISIKEKRSSSSKSTKPIKCYQIKTLRCSMTKYEVLQYIRILRHIADSSHISNITLEILILTLSRTFITSIVDQTHIAQVGHVRTKIYISSLGSSKITLTGFIKHSMNISNVGAGLPSKMNT